MHFLFNSNSPLCTSIHMHSGTVIYVACLLASSVQSEVKMREEEKQKVSNADYLLQLHAYSKWCPTHLCAHSSTAMCGKCGVWFGAAFKTNRVCSRKVREQCIRTAAFVPLQKITAQMYDWMLRFWWSLLIVAHANTRWHIILWSISIDVHAMACHTFRLFP